MRGLYTEARPEQLPEGASPLVINSDYIVGTVIPRPGLEAILAVTTTPPPPPPPPSPPAFVQSNNGRMCQCCDPSLTHVDVPFSNANAAGNVSIVVMGAHFKPGPISQFSISDTQGNIYKIVQTKLGTGQNGLEVGVIVWLAQNIKAGANTVTVSCDPVAVEGDVAVIALEYTPGSVPFDFDVGAATEYDNAQFGAILNTGSITPNQATSLLLSFAFSAYDTSFTSTVQDNGPLAFDKAVSNTGSGTAVTTPSVTPANSSSVALFAINVPKGNSPSFTVTGPWVGSSGLFPFGSLAIFEQPISAAIAGQATLAPSQPEWASIVAIFKNIGGLPPRSGPTINFSPSGLSGTTVIGTQDPANPGDFMVVYVACAETGANISVSDGHNTYAKVSEASVAGAYLAMFVSKVVTTDFDPVGGDPTLTISVTTDIPLTQTNVVGVCFHGGTYIPLVENDSGWTVRQSSSVIGNIGLAVTGVALSVADKVVTTSGTYSDDWFYNTVSPVSVVEVGISAFSSSASSGGGSGGGGGGSTALGPNVNYIKTFEQQDGDIFTLVLDNTGTMWREDVINNEGVLTPVYTAIEPNTFAQSATVDDREFIALSNLLNGTDIPYTYNGENFDRLSQVGPGSPPTVNFLQSQFVIAPPPNGLTQPPADAGVVGTNSSPGFFQSVTWANSAPSGRSPGNILTIFYAQDSPDPLAVVGNIVELTGMANMNGQNPNGTYLIIANGFDLPGGDAGAPRYWFAVSTETVNGVFNTGGPNNQSGNYQITRATVTTLVPVPNIVIGSQITIVGAAIPRWDGTWTVTGTPTSGQFVIDQTSLAGDVASYQYTLTGGTAPTVGQQISIIGCTNGPLVNGTSIFNVQNATIISVSPGVFSIALVGPNIVPAAEDGSATTSGTQFNFDPGAGLLGSATDAGYQTAIFGNSGDGNILGAGTIAAGQRKVCYSFLTRNGYLTKPSPITTVNISQGASALTIGGLLTGPSNVVARVIHLTPANGGNFYNIPEPVTVNVGGLITVNQSTWVRDNTSASVTLSFSDGVLLAADEIDIQGNNLFETAEVGSSLGVIPYGARVALIGEQNKLTNLLNWSFDGGKAPSGYPAGWAQDPTAGAGGSLVNSPIFGFAYQITNGSGSTQALLGLIAQPAFQDEFQVPIIEASTTYSARVTALLNLGATPPSGGTLVVDLFDPLANRILGRFQIPFSSMTATMQIFTGTLLTTGLAPVPNGLLLRIYATNVPSTQTVIIDRVEIFPTEQPDLGTQVTVSYVNNFEAFDQVTGVVDTAVQNQQPVRSAFTLYDTLYLVKSSSLVAVQDNNTTEPEGWTVRMVSTSVGTPSIYGVTTAIDEPESGEQWALIANQNGLFYFDGGQPEKISGEIEKLWKQINWAYGHTIWIKNDIINRRIYVGVPLKVPAPAKLSANVENQWLPSGIIPDDPNPTTPNVVLMLNYKQIQSGAALSERPGVHASAFTGKLLATEITRAWAIWTIRTPCAAFITRKDLTAPLFIGNSTGTGKIYELVDDLLEDDGSPICQIYDTYGFVTAEQAQALRLGSSRYFFEYMNIVITGSGELTITVYPNTLDTPYARALLPNLILPGSTNGDLEYPVQEAGNRLFLQFKCFAVGAGFYLSRIAMAMRSDPWSPVRGRNI